MTVSLLAPPEAPPTERLPGGLLAMPSVVRARECLVAAGRVELGRVGEDELGSLVAELAAVESQAAALRLAVLAQADARRVADGSGDTGTDAWAAGLCGSTRRQMAAGLRLARLLDTTYAATREAYAAGRLRAEQVRVIVNAAEQAPADATPEQISLAEEHLVAKATGASTRSGRPMNATRLRQVAPRMFDVVDVDLANRHQLAMIHRETRSAAHETYLMFDDDGDGTWSGRFRIPELPGQLLRASLERLTAPRRMTTAADGTALIDESAPGHAAGQHRWEADGHALCELIEHLSTTGYGTGQGAKGGGDKPVTVLVHLDLDTLLARLHEPGVATMQGATDGDVTITAADARRLARESGLVPVVLGGESMPLDLGRTRRLHTHSQRLALATKHDSCAIGGCSRPYAWCEIHHPVPWSHGGPTDLDNALPLCGHHHRRAHDPDFTLGQDTGTGWRLHPRR